MLPAIKSLLILQNRDTEVIALKREIKRLPAEEENAKTRLSDDLTSVAEITARLQAKEIEIKNLELDIQTRRDTIEKLKVQQFQTKKNEEYAALGTEVIRYEKDVSSLEDQELERMEESEGIRAELATAKEKLAVTQGHVDDELEAIGTRKTGSEKRIAEIETERVGLAEKIPEETLPEYERILKAKGDIAVVPLRNNNCGGCHMKVQGTVAQGAKAAQEIILCGNCGRIIYYAEE